MTIYTPACEPDDTPASAAKGEAEIEFRVTMTHDANHTDDGNEGAAVVSSSSSDELAMAVERGSAAWFRQRAGQLGCENWRGPKTVWYAADMIERLTATIKAQEETIRADGEDRRHVIDWLTNLAVHDDLEDVVADGGITASMVFQQEARSIAARLAARQEGQAHD